MVGEVAMPAAWDVGLLHEKPVLLEIKLESLRQVDLDHPEIGDLDGL